MSSLIVGVRCSISAHVVIALIVLKIWSADLLTADDNGVFFRAADVGNAIPIVGPLLRSTLR